jgi:type II secretory ATPase GspE/PulE/Tfp pilus assembly ATPase PilB-like protein
MDLDLATDLKHLKTLVDAVESEGYDFATGLRHILRQDPNVIMVGEIRDKT